MKFRLPFGSRAQEEGTPEARAGGISAAPRLGGRFVTLILVFPVLLGTAGYLVWDNYLDSKHGAQYIADAGQLRMLSQRLAKASLQGLFGSSNAFKQVKESRDSFATILARLQRGGEVGGEPIPASPERVAPALEALAREWSRTERNADTLVKEQDNLIGLGKAVSRVNGSNPLLLDLAEQVQALKLESRASARELSAAAQLVMLTQRMAKNANALLAGESIDPEVAFLLGKDTNQFRGILEGLQKGSPQLRLTASTDPDTTAKLGELGEAFKTYTESVSSILGNMQRLLRAKNSAFAVFNDSEKLLGATERLAAEYEATLADNKKIYLIGVTVALMVLVLLMIGALFVKQERARREAAETQEASAKLRNEQNQEAILRLLNEMQTFAEGDLTVRATVNEDITGAIADSVNFAIEELRSLVGRINVASEQVTSTSESAQKTSSELLAAAQSQSEEIKTTSAQVLGMARAINEVSASASESANVARASLSAAEKGQQAVYDAINGMNEIRGQIQETAKRIKRLGESSQEIGEIVELISDLTEQTNVLALNAAIQAASAGEAGRGFTVVAEEVQRLAERSAEATKQIGAIVRTIQTDTQDAVSAMEKSTQGVVEGTRLSDAAGQALSEIGQVSQKLAVLIEEISKTTQGQARAAGGVATSMRHILGVTEQTTEGTKRTASSVGQIASLARDLRSSVSNFKL
jgi:twitching motility protein PilJ